MNMSATNLALVSLNYILVLKAFDPPYLITGFLTLQIHLNICLL